MISYDDVYIKPQNSSIKSRSNTRLETRLTRNHNIGCPVVASPMDTVMSKEMAVALDSHDCVGILHRFQDPKSQASQVSDLAGLASGPVHRAPVCASIGATGNFLKNARRYVSAGVDVVLIDVAHGDHDHVESAIKTLHEKLYSFEEREFDIIAGNVATGEGAARLARWGADAVRVGVGNGCFTPDMKVRMKDGEKKISDIEPGDRVGTHCERWREVLNVRKRNHEGRLMVIDGIECTPDHEFYVVHQSELGEVTDQNVHRRAEWVEAQNLTEDHWQVRVAEIGKLLDSTKSIEERKYSGEVYDLEVKDDHSYNIGGTVVHNSVCSTRLKTGVGVGQITAIRESVRALEREAFHDVPVIADGGIRQPGDAAKALSAGADSVMVGSILAGTDETPGKVKAKENGWPDRELYKEYRGSASQGVKDSDDFVEGVSRTVPYRGPVRRIISDLKDGLRSSFSYVGASTVEEFRAKAVLNEVSGSTTKMGSPHHRS